MDYFLITQDNRWLDRVVPIANPGSLFNHETAADKPDELTPIQINVREAVSPEYVDFIERPLALVSERLKRVWKMVEPEAVFAPVVLTEVKRNVQKLYWHFNPPKIRCLSTQAEFYPNQTIKKLVINPATVADYRIFKIDQTLEPFIVCNLVVVESMLRRGFTGFKFTKVELD